MFAVRAMIVVTLAFLAGCDEKIVFDDGLAWPTPPGLPEIGQGKIIVTDSGSDTVTWIDLATLERVYTQPVGLLPPEREGPHHGAAASDGSAFFIGLSNYVPGSGSGPHGSHGNGTVDGYLLKYDAQTLELVGSARVSRSPGDVRITPDGTKLLQSHYDLIAVTEWAENGGPLEDSYAPIAIIDAATMDVELVTACPTPHGIAVATDSSEAYTSCAQSDELAIVSLTPPYPVTRVAIGAAPNDPSIPATYEPYSVATHPVDHTVWVSNLKSADIRVLDPATKQWVGQPIPIQGVPFFGAFTADGAYYYAAVQASNSFVVIDGVTRQEVVSLPLPSEACYLPHSVTLLPDEKRALVVCEGDHALPDISNGTVAVVNLQNPVTPTLEKYIEVGVFPDDAFLLMPAGQ